MLIPFVAEHPRRLRVTLFGETRLRFFLGQAKVFGEPFLVIIITRNMLVRTAISGAFDAVVLDRHSLWVHPH